MNALFYRLEPVAINHEYAPCFLEMVLMLFFTYNAYDTYVSFFRLVMKLKKKQANTQRLVTYVCR